MLFLWIGYTRETMKKTISMLLVLVLLCAGCAFGAAEGSKTDRIEKVFELYQKSKYKAMELMGITDKDLTAVFTEPGRNFVAYREEYENEELFLRLFFMEDAKVFGYRIIFYYPTAESLQKEYEQLKAIVNEHCTLQESGNDIYMTEDGAAVRFGLFDSGSSGSSHLATGIFFQLWEQPK